MVYFITYVSSAYKKLDTIELTDLLQKSQKNNLKRNITGMLLYCDGDFIQTLEGEESIVKEAYQIIHQDSRHRCIIKIKEGTHHSRNFSSWSMGFRNLGREELTAILGYKSFDQKNLFNEFNSTEKHPAVLALSSFYKNQPIHRRP